MFSSKAKGNQLFCCYDYYLLRTTNSIIFYFINKSCHYKYFLAAVGIEWILDNDASSAAVLVASEAHAITLAIEGLLGVVFTVATLTDEAVDNGEVIDAGFSSLCHINVWLTLYLSNLFLLVSCFPYFPLFKPPA